MFKPAIIQSLKNYNTKTFLSDLIAGLIVGIVSLPLSIAFAIASGASPERGITTSIIAGIIIAIFGGSKVQIAGPTGAFVIIIYGIIENFGMSGLLVTTILAGLILIAFGIFKFGGLIKFIPHTIVTGFNAGIALSIFTSQIGDFLGLQTGKMPIQFISKISVYIKTIASLNIHALLLGTLSLAIIFLWPRITKKIPGSIIVIIVATAISQIFKLPIETIGSRYGSIPSTIPMPKIPSFSLDLLILLFPQAISLAVLVSIESLMTAVVADGMTGKKHNSNTELIGQGIANIICPLFGGLPSIGALARTATNIKNGGQTPIASIVHSIVLLVIMLFLGQFVVFIPMAALAAILISVAINMAGIKDIRFLLRGQKSDISVLVVTFLATVFIDLTVAIAIGLVLAAFLFIRKIIEVSAVYTTNVQSQEIFQGLDEEFKTDVEEEELSIPKGVLIYEIEGPLFFGTVQKFENAVARAEVDFKVLIVRTRRMIYLDAGGLHALNQVQELCKRRNVQLLISGIHTQPYTLLVKSGFEKKLGENAIFQKIDDALAKAEELIAAK